MRILIVTYNWPPRNAIGTHRPYSWAKVWSEKGADVTVLTAKKQSYDQPLDLKLPVLPNVKVIEVSPNIKVGVISLILRLGFIRKFAKKIKSLLGLRLGVSGDPRLSWLQDAEDDIKILAQSVDVVVSTFGPSSSHLIANDIKKINQKIFWVADYRDLWSSSHLSFSHVDYIDPQEIETVGKRADLVTAVSYDMVNTLSDLLGVEAIYLPNGFDLTESNVDELIAKKPVSSGGAFRIVHTGMLYDGHRDPEPLLSSLVRLEQQGLIERGSVTVDFYGARIDVAINLSKKEKYRPFIRIMGHVSRDEAIRAQRNADLLLLLESSREEARGVLTGKIFEYIVAGKPILCVGSKPDFEIGKVLASTRTGEIFGPEQFLHIDQSILETISGRGLYKSYCPDKEKIMLYSRERQSNGFLSLIQDRVKGS